MRIICKYKDFYDFLAIDNDPDIVYVRTPKLVFASYNELFLGNSSAWNPSKVVPNGYSRQALNKREGEMEFTNYVFGIYPNVYSQPVLSVGLRHETNLVEWHYCALSKDWCEEYGSLNTKKEKLEMRTAEAMKFVKELVKGNKYVKVPREYHKAYDYDINCYIWKVECPEIFMKIGAPVFVFDDARVLGPVYGSYEYRYKLEKIGTANRPSYMTNVCFSKLEGNILKCWFDELNDLNTYINIENFLWASKQEPEHIPDNNTKIINHGFDLKTSFRKM